MRPGESSVRRLDLPDSPLAPRIARRAVRETLRGNGADEDTVHRALLLTSELVTNALRHAAAGGARQFWVEILVAAGTLRIAVHDGDSTPPTPSQAGADAEGGRGLHIVATEAKEWGVIRTPGHTGKTVWCALPLPDRGALAGP